MYFYDPKTKDDLPYYDRFPLIFVAEKYKDGFLGLNLHYLPPIFRARLMDALYKIERNDSVRDSKKLKMTYNLMKSAAQFRYFKPCVKRYLYSQIKSRFLYIPYEDWDIALFLPTERFKKAKKQKVWEDSKRIIRK
jgi:E3 ubiquitin-protein ligase DOA10